MKDYIKFLHDLGIDLTSRQIEAIEEWLRNDRAETWDDGARRAGRYGHPHGRNGGPHRDNPFRSEQEIIDMYGEDEDGYW